MSCCTIFNKNFVTDITHIDQVSVNINFLKTLIPAYNVQTSGLWRPIVITPRNSQITYADLLSHPNTSIGNSVNPCECNPNFINDFEQSAQNTSINCDYCKNTYPSNHTAIAYLQDTNGNYYQTDDGYGNISTVYMNADCCTGACDTRMLKDDYLPKIPFLNQKYLKTFHDFKYHKQFPATTNAGLGCELFIQTETSNLDSFDSGGPKLGIDWTIKDRMSEIPYDPMLSQYDNQTDHEKAYARSLHTSSTCGHFIFTSSSRMGGSNAPYYSILEDGVLSTLPKNDDFQKVPYGFSDSTYNNIFIGQDKICSNWKWNYSSGILCWYRYFNIDTPADKDTRPIRQVDLYIPSGDVFYATNDGPEPYTTISEGDSTSAFIKACPSGLKIIKGTEVKAVIPSGSSFTYISANLYPHFLDIYNRLSNAPDNLSLSNSTKFNLAALLCTAPQYDAITVDLLKRNLLYSYAVNNYKQIDILDKHMSTIGIGSDNELNYIKDKKSLILTLANKYGSYLLFEPNKNTTLSLSKNMSEGVQFYADLDYDMTIPITSRNNNQTNCGRIENCSAPQPLKRFTYDQKFELGSSLFLNSTIYTDAIYYNKKCVNNNLMMDPKTAVKTANLSFHGGFLGSEVYSSGCVILQDSYPRIITENITGFCNNCTSSEYSRFSYIYDDSTPDGAENSSYKLFIKSRLNNSENLCWYEQNDKSFCDYSLGRFYNNSEIGDVYGSRPLRSIKDGSLYLKRTYNVVMFDPRIEKVAFHNQGGIYFSSKSFGASSGLTAFGSRQTIPNDRLKITFSNKDVAIKLYGLKIEKLRSTDRDTYSCLGFPTKDACKCYSLIKQPVYHHVCSYDNSSSNSRVIYETSIDVPPLSTKHSPSILSYGGFSNSELRNMFGDDYLIPGHPNPLQTMPSLDSKIDPLYPYGCEKHASISLYNYVNSSWPVKFPNFSTYHADIWATVSENVDLFKPTSYSEIADDNDNYNGEIIQNKGYQRFASKVTINNVNVYDKQSAIVYAKDSYFSNTSTINIDIENPYLVQVLGGPHNLYPANGYLCTNNSINTNIFSSRGDESVIVPITISCIPRKQVLNFAIKKPSNAGMGTLSRGFFHPNSGIKLGYKTDQSPIKKIDNKLFIDYDKTLLEEESTANEYNQDRIVLIGDITQNIKNVLSKIDDLDYNKKLKLYLYINSKWYEYAPDHSFGFIKNGKTYIGNPFTFEYTGNDSVSKIPGPIVPTSPKVNKKFQFVYNYVPFRNEQKIIYSNDYNYLLNNLTYRKITDEYVLVEGSRAYFALNELDFAIHVDIEDISHINELEDEIITSLEALKTNRLPIEIVLRNNKRYRYKYRSSDTLTNPSSYYECVYNNLYKNYTDLISAIDLNNTNGLYYILNTNKTCYQYVTFRSKTSEKIARTKIVVQKLLFCTKTDEYGNLAQFDNSTIKKYTRVYTLLKLSTPLQEAYDPTEGYLDITGLSSSSNKYGADSFTIFNDDFALKKETDRNLSNPFYASKWGDLIHYDGQINNDLAKYIDNEEYIRNTYPRSSYNNFFYKTIINDCNINQYSFVLSAFDTKNPDTTLKLNYFGSRNFLIHQKYNIGLNDYKTSNNYEQYHNYLPFMDLNLIPYGGQYNSDIRRNIISYLPSTVTGNIFSGIIQISGIYRNVEEYDISSGFIDPENSEKIWIDLPKTTLKPALTINSDIFYSNTLRVDDAPYTLSTITYGSNYSSQNIRAIFQPGFDPPVDPPIASLDFTHFGSKTPDPNVFARFPIYGDTDSVSGCSVTCGINTVGYASFSSKYNIYSQGSSVAVPGNIGDNIPFIISHDNGFYNVLGNNKTHYIQRIELDASNDLFPTNNCDPSISPLPLAVKNSCLNNKYQYILSDNLTRNNSHSSVVSNTDMVANEMLFRLLYGEKQKINLKVLDDHTKPLDYKDLMAFVYPKTEAKDIYKNIPYDLDRDSTGKVAVSGSISIKGGCNIDDRVVITIGSKVITINIYRSNNDILMGVSAGSESFSRKIHTLSTETIGYFASTNSNLTGPTITAVSASCRQPGVTSISPAATYLSATVSSTGPDGRTSVVNFPYWKDDFSDCPCAPNRDGLIRFYVGQDHPYIAFEHNPGCAPNVLPFTRCTNRCTVNSLDSITPPGCSLVTLSSSEVQVNGYARGVFGPGCVDVGGVTSLNFVDDTGCVDDIARARITMDAGGSPSIGTSTTPPCGTCYTLDYENPNIHIGYFNTYLPTGAAGDSCECRNWEYGYCRNTNNASACVCNALTYDYTELSYDFQYCRYSISLRGFKRRLIYPENLSYTSYSLPTCGSTGNTGYPPGSSTSTVGRVKEWCGALVCTIQPEQTWHVYKTSTSTSTPYVGSSCHTANFCTVAYNNNSITIRIRDTAPICIDNSITSCPYIKLDMPPNYTAEDTIASECSECLYTNNNITVNNTSQPTEIVTETRTCVLGLTQLGDDQLVIGMNRQVRGCAECGNCDSNKCRTEVPVAGYGVCGRSAPQSFPKKYCISYAGASACGNTVYGCDIEVGNSVLATLAYGGWVEAMNIAYANSAPCFANTSISASDIVEGVVPGSCSDLQITTVSIPAISYRATLSHNVEIGGAGISYAVAYYTYTYKRRKTIQDILKDNPSCTTTSASCVQTPPYLEESFRTDCNSTLSCYNKDALPLCGSDDNRYCCKAGKNESI